MAYFADWELKLLNSLTLDKSARPFFDAMRDCLVWPDEEPESWVGECLIDLLIVRSFIHHGKERPEWWAISPTTHFAEVWDEAIAGAPNWPGFKRLTLNAVDRAYFEQQLARPADDFF
jgi:hypothetical protein